MDGPDTREATDEWPAGLTRRAFIRLAGSGTVAAHFAGFAGVGGRRFPLVAPAGPDRDGRRPAPRRQPSPRRRFGIEESNDILMPATGHRPDLSPDGRLLGWAGGRLGDIYLLAGVGEPEFDTGAPGRWTTGVRLWITDTADGSTWPLPGDGRAWSPRWSPDGRRLAYLADHARAVQVWVWERRGRPRRLSEAVVFGALSGVDVPQWSPDSATIFVPLRPEGPVRTRGADGDGLSRPAVDILVAPIAPLTPSNPSIATLPGQCRDLGVIDARTGRSRRIRLDFPAFAFHLAPDASRLAVLTVPVATDPKTYTFRQDLYLIDAEGGSAARLATGLPGYTTTPAWSPDSTRLAFVADGAVTVADVRTGRLETLGAGPGFGTEPFRASPTPLLWHPDGRRLVAQASDGRLWSLTAGGSAPPMVLDTPDPHPEAVHRPGTSRLLTSSGDTALVVSRRPGTLASTSTISGVPLDGSPAAVLVEVDGTASFATGGVSDDGRTIVFTAEDDDRPADFWAFAPTEPAPRSPRQLTRLNPRLEGLTFGRSRRLPFTSASKREALGSRLLLPGEGDPPFPTVVCVYPSAVTNSRSVGRWDALDQGIVHAQILAGRGWAVLFPDWPTGRPHTTPGPEDTAEIVDPAIDAAVSAGFADPARLAVIGQSNGGCAVNLLVTTTDRFKAAVSADGMSDLFSFFGQLRITPDGYPLGFSTNVAQARGMPPWAGDGLRRDSAVARLDRVATPLLLVHGRDDSVVGFEQSGEMFVGLSFLGKEVTLLAYHGESHVPSRFREANRVHMTNEVLAFLDHHLG